MRAARSTLSKISSLSSSAFSHRGWRHGDVWRDPRHLISGKRVARELRALIDARGKPRMIVSGQWHRVHPERHPRWAK
jgi:hypothetical protein